MRRIMLLDFLTPYSHLLCRQETINFSKRKLYNNVATVPSNLKARHHCLEGIKQTQYLFKCERNQVKINEMPIVFSKYGVAHSAFTKCACLFGS